MTAADVVRAFKQAMRSNGWDAVGRHLSPDFRGVWPQAGEVMMGRAGLVAMQAALPGQVG